MTRTPDLTVADVALELGLTTATVCRYFEQGLIPGAYRLPRTRRASDGSTRETGAWRIAPADLDAWRDDRRTGVTDPHRIEPRTPRARSARGRRTA